MATGNTFYVNGTDIDPLVWTQGSDVGLTGVTTTVPQLIADATSINGSTSISFTEGAANGTSVAIYEGGTNIFGDETTADFSLAYRISHDAVSQIGGFTGPRIGTLPSTHFSWYINSGAISAHMLDETGNYIFNNQSFGGSLSTDTWYDVVFTWDNSANELSCYVDDSLLSTETSARRFGIGGLTFDPHWVSSVTMGSGVFSSASNYKTDEIAAFNYVLSSPEIAFFEGASRSSYYAFTPTVPSSGGGSRITKLGGTGFY